MCVVNETFHWASTYTAVLSLYVFIEYFYRMYSVHLINEIIVIIQLRYQLFILLNAPFISETSVNSMKSSRTFNFVNNELSFRTCYRDDIILMMMTSNIAH